ncbi:MAG: NAD(P)-binding domain-containing protein [Bacteroidetes bacterium]|nr:NAD(P)-binding domain-containing protein [Bacteroidota bacterium]
MKIAIIGTGNIGSRLAKQWAKAGHEIFLGVRDVANHDVTELLNDSRGKLQILDVKHAADNADIITICVGYKQLQNVLDQMGVQENKLIIETVNASFEGGKDVAKLIAETVGSNRIIKAFNSIGAENLDDPIFNEIPADTFICGGNTNDIQTVTALAKSIGFANVYHIGGIEKENLLEQLAAFWGALAFGAELGRYTAFKILTKTNN